MLRPKVRKRGNSEIFRGGVGGPHFSSPPMPSRGFHFKVAPCGTKFISPPGVAERKSAVIITKSEHKSHTPDTALKCEDESSDEEVVATQPLDEEEDELVLHVGGSLVAEYRDSEELPDFEVEFPDVELAVPTGVKPEAYLAHVKEVLKACITVFSRKLQRALESTSDLSPSSMPSK